MRVPRLDALSRMDWLGPARARAWLLILAVMTWSLAALWVLLSRNGLDPAGLPVGADFIGFWSAGRLATSAGPAAPYDAHLLHALQKATFDGAKIGFTPFPYPPIYLLLCIPLGALPYAGALGLWLVATGAAYLAVLRRFLAATPQRLLMLVAYPGVLVNAANGQNGFLSTALFGAAALNLQRRPILAGACLGALVYKPHLGILVPIALLATGAWGSIAAAAVTVLALSGVATTLFGVQPWQGFLDQAPFISKVVADGLLEPGKVQSMFAAAKLVGMSAGPAFAIQAVWTAGAAVSLLWLGRRIGAGQALGASLVSATLIASPYLLPYDLVLAAIPLAWLFNEAQRTGFMPWEKFVLVAGFTLPLVSIPLALTLGIPIAPVVLTGLYVAVWRRAWALAQCSPATERDVGYPRLLNGSAG